MFFRGGIAIIKNEIRKRYLDLRNNQGKNDLVVWSENIISKLNQMPCIIPAKSIMCFVSFGSEVNTHGLIKRWLAQGKQVSVPCIEKINKDARLMHAVEITDFSDLKSCGSFGILEPELKQSSILNPADLDVVLVPGSVFDLNRNRIGYGGGFYDRFLLKTSSKCKKIGICYDFQVLETVPHEDHDVQLDLLVTEKRVIG